MTIKAAIKYFKSFTIGTAISTLLLGCVEEIDFESGSTPRLLVVDGRITNSGSFHVIKLGMTTANLVITNGKISSLDIVIPVKFADITIFDNLGNQEDYFETEPGVYLLYGNILYDAIYSIYNIGIIFRLYIISPDYKKYPYIYYI